MPRLSAVSLNHPQFLTKMSALPIPDIIISLTIFPAAPKQDPKAKCGPDPGKDSQTLIVKHSSLDQYAQVFIARFRPDPYVFSSLEESPQS